MHYPEILAITPAPVSFAYEAKDTILYALGVGMANDPLDEAELRFVIEKDLVAMPTMAAILGGGAGEIIMGGGLDFARILHGEQRVRLNRPLPPAARMMGVSRCLSVVDKGVDHGALLNVETVLTEAGTGAPVATVIRTLFCRGDGGCGGDASSALKPHPIPDRAPDREIGIATRPDQALLYRLNGDRNPLHCDPAVAAKAGFPRPILHGLCTYGIACRAVMQAYCGNDPAPIRAFDVRFSAPVFPGETIVTRLWRDGAVVSFDCRVLERDVTVIDNGYCELVD